MVQSAIGATEKRRERIAVELGLRALGSGTDNAKGWQFIRNGSEGAVS